MLNGTYNFRVDQLSTKMIVLQNHSQYIWLTNIDNVIVFVAIITSRK
jgi:hypothetical protein